MNLFRVSRDSSAREGRLGNSLKLGVTTVLFLGGCAAGVKHDYDQKDLDLGVTTSATVAVAALDHRPYVVDGNKHPNFVGLSRGGFAQPFNVTTQSGKPLASDISGSIAASLKGKGMDAKVVELKPALSLDEARTALLAAGSQRSLLFTIREWKADSYYHVGLGYDLDLRVFDGNGNTLASKTLLGVENLGSAYPVGGSAQVTPRFRRMMEMLFQDPDIVKALRL